MRPVLVLGSATVSILFAGMTPKSSGLGCLKAHEDGER